ncbi:MAG: hypothetical protein AMXMBFR64_32320 [Myxococcales bacterium]
MSRLDQGRVGALAVQRGHVTVEQLDALLQEIPCPRDGEALLARMVDRGLVTPEQARSLRIVGGAPPEAPSRAETPPARPAARPRPSVRRSAITRPDGKRQKKAEHVTVIPPPEARSTVPPEVRPTVPPELEVAEAPLTVSEAAERARRILDETRAARNALTRSERVGSRHPTEPPQPVTGGSSVKPLVRRTPVSLLSLPEDADLSGPGVIRDGKYLIGAEVGRGGMGAVRLAEDLDLGRRVALKTLLAGPDAEERMLRALINEARTTGQLQHPNIVPVHDIGVLSTGEVYYTMKLVGHQSLRDVLHGLSVGDRAITAEFTTVRLLTIAQSVCMALHYAHSRGVVHRDVKPENILLGSFGEVHLMDWGIAKVIGRTTPLEGTSFASDGFVAGTPAYMAPEQARGDYTGVDDRSDIYSLGVILYELLTLALPVEPPEHVEELGRAKEQPVVPPSERCPERRIAPELDAICLKALAVSPEDRYQDARAVWREIELHLEGTKESQRLAQRAKDEVRRAEAAGVHYRELLEEQERLTDEVDRAERRVTPWDPEQDRLRLWRQRNRVGLLELAIGRAFAEAVKYYNRALGYDPEHGEARAGLARLYEAGSRAAERKHDIATMIYFGDMQRELVGEGNETGRLTIRSYPGGARLHLLPADALDGEVELSESTLLGVAPVHEQEVESGGYMIVATLEGHRETFLPVVVRSGESHATLVRLHPASADVPLVGKDEELGRLRVLLRSVVDRGMLRAVLVSGAAGIGKSRMLEAFDDYVQDLPEVFLYMQVECRRLFRWVPFSGLADLVRYRAGVVPGDTAEVVRERVEEMVSYALTGLTGRASLDPDGEDRVRTLSTRLLRMPGLLPGRAELPPELTSPAEDIQEAVIELFTLLSAQRPMIVYLHDMHSIDRTSRAVIDALVRRLEAAPVLLVATCNSDELGAELLESFPFNERLRLHGLRREGVAQLLREILKGPVSEDLVYRMHRHTGGSPLAVEATLRMLIEERRLDVQGGDYTLVASATPLLQGAFDLSTEVHRRLGTLREGDQAAVRAASVVGDAFWTGALRALGIPNARDVVRRLIKADLVARHPLSQFSGFDEYRFRQNSMRDAVYAAIPAEERARLHGLLVPWLESRPERGPVWRAAMAEHLVGAGQDALAAQHHVEIANAAEQLASWQDASMHLRRAAELSPEPADRTALLERMAAMMARTGVPKGPEGVMRVVIAEQPLEE